ncbi:MAG: hypothetical protein ACK550_11670, partial [Synechococcaceae cyanobacterium]
IDSVSEHATATYDLATKNTLGLLPAPASKVATGVAADKLKDWLSADDYEKVEPCIGDLQRNIADSCYLQATIGVLPSAVGRLLAAASADDSLLYSGGTFSDIYAAIDKATKATAFVAKEHEYIKSIQGEAGLIARQALGGILHLLVMYLVGEALSQTSAFPGGTIKNAVPFLVKIDPKQIVTAGDIELTIFNSVTDELVSAVAAALSLQPEISVQYWLDKGYATRDRGIKSFVTTGTVKNLVSMFLQGKKPPNTDIQTGSRLKTPDRMTEITKDTKYQQGIPVEYRYIKARPTASGLKAELLKIVDQARKVNLESVPEKQRHAILEQVKK